MNTSFIKTEDFNLYYTLDAGQNFNFSKIDKERYRGVIKSYAIIISQKKDILKIESYPKIPEEVIREYFNLDIDYKNIILKIKKDKNLKNTVEKYRGLRIIKQDEYECLFSYIISSYNSIKKIKYTYEYLSKTLGERIIDDFYTFPKTEILKNTDLNILKEGKLGYRDKYIKNTAKIIYENNINLYEYKYFEYDKVKEELKKFPGIGDKVAECTMLYSMNFHNAFPKDRWIKKYLSSDNQNFDINIYSGYAGWAQLFIFLDIRKK